MATKSVEILVLGGGNAAGYFAKAAAESGLTGVTIVGEEPVVSYERPALTKAYLFPQGAARLPGFHTCVGGGGERQEPAWYGAKGIEFLTSTRITAVDVAAKTAQLEEGGSITWGKLVIATGARAVSLADFGSPGATLPGIHTLRNLADADALLADLAATREAGGKVVVVGGGYIGMEAAAGLRLHGVDVTVLMPEDRLMARILPTELAAYYETYYEAKGIKIIKGVVATGFTAGAGGKVASVQLKDGSSLDASMVVVGVGARPSSQLFKDQLQTERTGGLVVDGLFRCFKAGTEAPLEDVYAVGDVAAFPLTMEGGALVRQEHVTHARQSAAQAAAAIAGKAPAAYDYLPFFYSRVFDLSWQFYGLAPATATVIPFGLPAALEAAAEAKPAMFGAFWVDGGKVKGVFIESGSAEDNAAAKAVARAQPVASEDLGAQGVDFLLSAAAKL